MKQKVAQAQKARYQQILRKISSEQQKKKASKTASIIKAGKKEAEEIIDYNNKLAKEHTEQIISSAHNKANNIINNTIQNNTKAVLAEAEKKLVSNENKNKILIKKILNELKASIKPNEKIEQVQVWDKVAGKNQVPIKEIAVRIHTNKRVLEDGIKQRLEEIKDKIMRRIQ